MRYEHVKERINGIEGIRTILSQPKSKNIRVSDVELNSVQYGWTLVPKLNRKHKNKVYSRCLKGLWPQMMRMKAVDW
jgi:hypothetical protein